MTSLLRTAPFLLGLLALPAQPIHAQGVTVRDAVVVATPPSDAEAVLRAARAFYDFWNTGDEALLRAAIDPGFTDHTLPPTGP